MANVFYNRMIRKLTVAFGDLFNNITLVRYNPDLTEQERFIVPIDYATKELYVMRLQGDPELDKKVMMTLPRMSYEMTGLSYDASRKQITNTKNFYQNGNDTVSQYAPVPYDFDFSLFLYVRNIEDGNQIIEHILPFFAPDYTIKVNMIPEMGIVKEVPVVLKSVDYNVDYEGDRDRDTRIVIWTLTFTVKGFIFGATSNASSSIIKTSFTNVMNDIEDSKNVVFNVNANGTGNYSPAEYVYQGTSLPMAIASAKVVNWNPTNKQLTVENATGNFVSARPLIGANNNAQWIFNSYDVVAKKYASITVTPNPTSANANSAYTYTTTITEKP
jgi:hypothetical protein